MYVYLSAVKDGYMWAVTQRFYIEENFLPEYITLFLQLGNIAVSFAGISSVHIIELFVSHNSPRQQRAARS